MYLYDINCDSLALSNCVGIFQIPPDLVAKSQPTDIIDIIL